MAIKYWKRALGTTAMAALMLMGAEGTLRAQTLSRFDLSVNYVATVSNAMPGSCGCFVMNGGGTEDVFHLRPQIAIVGDISVVHTNNINGTGSSLGLATYLGGVRYSYRNHTRLLPYAQGMLGGVHGFDSVFPGAATSTANSFAYDLGAGLELSYNKRLAFRLVEASFLRTGLPNNVNSTQGNLKLAAGVIVHLK